MMNTIRWPHHASINAKNWELAWDWLKDQHGYPGNDRSSWVYVSQDKDMAIFGFTDENSRNWFILRWA